MKNFLLLSVSVVCIVTLTEKANAGLGLPNVAECRKEATDRASMNYCGALEECMRDASDDLASLKGCVLEAQDAYAAHTLQNDELRGVTDTSPRAPEDLPIDTKEVNSMLIEGIQGEKGFTQQQEGPND